MADWLNSTTDFVKLAGSYTDHELFGAPISIIQMRTTDDETETYTQYCSPQVVGVTYIPGF